MASVNKIILIGNVGKDPEMRFTPSGKPVTNFSLAINRKYNGSDGELRDETTWFTITAWDKLAETVNQYVSKGQQVYVEGSIKLEEWEGQDGQKHSRLAVTANNVTFLGQKKESAASEDLGPDDIPF